MVIDIHGNLWMRPSAATQQLWMFCGKFLNMFENDLLAQFLTCALLGVKLANK